MENGIKEILRRCSDTLLGAFLILVILELTLGIYCFAIIGKGWVAVCQGAF